MSFKQKIGCLLCAGLLMGSSAQADMDTVYQEKDASAVWQSNSGKMQIYLMDTQMYRPEAAQLYLTDVTPRLFTKEEILRVLQVFEPEMASISSDYQEIYKNLMQLEIQNHRLTLTAEGAKDNGTWSEVRIKCAWNNSQYVTGYMQLLQRIHTGNAKHCRYTMEEARELADAAAAAIAPDYAYSAWGFLDFIPRDGSDTNVDDYDYIEGLQLLLHARNGRGTSALHPGRGWLRRPYPDARVPAAIVCKNYGQRFMELRSSRGGYYPPASPFVGARIARPPAVGDAFAKKNKLDPTTQRNCQGRFLHSHTTGG